MKRNIQVNYECELIDNSGCPEQEIGSHYDFKSSFATIEKALEDISERKHKERCGKSVQKYLSFTIIDKTTKQVLKTL